MRSLVAAAIVAGVMAQPAHAATMTRLLYASDWVGSNTIYSIDPSTAPRMTGQLTPRDEVVCTRMCGAVEPTPSPNGRWLVYVQTHDSDVTVYLARADGTRRRLISRNAQRGSVAWAPGSGRFAYGARDSLFVYDVKRSKSRRVDNNVTAAVYTASWAGPVLVYLRRPTKFVPGELVVKREHGRRLLATGVSEFALAPNGRWVAYVADGLRVVRTDKTGERRLADGLGGLAWSADSRLLAGAGYRSLPDYRGEYFVTVFDLQRASAVELSGATTPVRWSPVAHRLAFFRNGIEVADFDTQTRRAISADAPVELRWAPNGRHVAYVTRGSNVLLVEPRSHLRVASLDGGVRTVVDSGGPYGGTIRDVVWTEVPSSTRYRAPRDRTLATVSANELVALWPITRLASDGGRVAYAACNHVFVWTPTTGDVRQAEPVASLKPACGFENEPAAYADIYDLAIAGEQLEYGETYGCTGGQWTVTALTLDDPGAGSSLGRGVGTRCGPSFDIAFGDMLGSGNVLVHSAWRGRYQYGSPRPERIITLQQIRRIGVGVIAGREGPLIPLDVDDGRIAVSRGNTLAVMDGSGTELWSVPVAATAAMFAGDELALVRDGELRRYRSGTGAFLGSQLLPSGTAVRPCKTPFYSWCEVGTFTFQDGARGLVAYVADKRVHVLRLADGSDHDVGAGGMARFLDSGLVVADGARLRLIPFGALE